MKKLLYIGLVLVIILGVFLFLRESPSQVPEKDEVAETQTQEELLAELISEMSLDEKISQMIISGFSGTTLDEQAEDLIKNQKIGGMIFYSNNIESPSQTVELINEMKENNKENKFPLFLSIDQEGGLVARLPGEIEELPSNQRIGEINNPEFSYKIGELLGREVKEFGFNLNYAPVLDINSNPDNPVIGSRSFSNDKDIVSELGIETMKGIKSKDIIPVIKHFPGHGDTSVDSHLELPRVDKSLEELEDLELQPFEDAIDEGAQAVMIAHILLPELDENLPSSLSEKIIGDLLRDRLKFDGLVITDDMTMEAITDNFEIGDAAVESVKSGSDIILVAHEYENVLEVIDSLKEAVKNKEISEDRIDESLRRIIKIKREYKLNNDKVDGVDIDEINTNIEKLLEKYLN